MFLVSSCSFFVQYIEAMNEDVAGAAPTGDAPNYFWVINNVIAYWGATYIRCLTVLALPYDIYICVCVCVYVRVCVYILKSGTMGLINDRQGNMSYC